MRPSARSRPATDRSRAAAIPDSVILAPVAQPAPTTADQLARDQTWAYRARWNDPLVQVRVVRVGTRRPPRVLVRFIDDDFEGLEDWVPPARLKCRWNRVEEFRAREARWEDVTRESLPRDSPLESAAMQVFDELIDPALATTGYGATSGVTSIHDVSALAAVLDEDADAWRVPSSFVEDGALIVPWSVTERIAKRAAARDPHRLLRLVEREESDARREATYGSWYRLGRGEERHIAPEACAQFDEKHDMPVRAILREWAGQEPADVRDEIHQLRLEAAAHAALARAALAALRKHGHTREANRLERDHAPSTSDAPRGS